MEYSELYNMSDEVLNTRRVFALVEHFEKCQKWDDCHHLQMRQFWMMAAFFHGAKDQFEWAKKTLDAANDAACERLS